MIDLKQQILERTLEKETIVVEKAFPSFPCFEVSDCHKRNICNFQNSILAHAEVLVQTECIFTKKN